MTRWLQLALALSILLVGGFETALAATSTIVSVQTPRGVRQSFILIKPDTPPVASVVLFAGGHGALGLKSATSMNWGADNFLVRSRDKFAAQGFLVAVVDAPSDRQDGMNGVFRMSKPHSDDIEVVAAYLKKQADAPVWLVGTSMGTFSAAGSAISAKSIDGLVLTSTITRAKRDWIITRSYPNGVASMDLPRVMVPTLILSHLKDGCDITPAADAPKLKARLNSASKVEIVVLDGGDTPQSAPCGGKSQHGFLGIEFEAVATVAEFVKANGKLDR